ncbi:DUF6126 family protein [Streptomyces sp. I05A-00742]|uniref:DUF6126 family protein n=1 Tax=Streptomyces sp. I05A-00742 TaxID=2732853 RepID=UPI0014888E5D|nr:DUF6126 family protein [Streptomyces sp. I05A-00742]
MTDTVHRQAADHSETATTGTAPAPEEAANGPEVTAGPVVHAAGAGIGAGAGAGKAEVEDRAPMGMKVRVFIYLVAVHFISAFFFLLFYIGK